MLLTRPSPARCLVLFEALPFRARSLSFSPHTSLVVIQQMCQTQTLQRALKQLHCHHQSDSITSRAAAQSARHAASTRHFLVQSLRLSQLLSGTFGVVTQLRWQKSHVAIYFVLEWPNRTMFLGSFLGADKLGRSCSVPQSHAQQRDARAVLRLRADARPSAVSPIAAHN